MPVQALFLRLTPGYDWIPWHVRDMVKLDGGLGSRRQDFVYLLLKIGDGGAKRVGVMEGEIGIIAVWVLGEC